MNCIIIGLSNFGIALAQRLTAMGHEVLGVDADLNKVNDYKDGIKNTIALNANNMEAVKTLPIRDSDIIFVTIRKDIGASVLSVALLKENHARRIVACAVSDIHTTILKNMGITEIIRPEKEFADLFTTKIEFSGSIYTYKVTNEYFIQEMKLPDPFTGRRIADVKFEKDLCLKLIAVKHTENGKLKLIDEPQEEYIIEKDDIFILAGNPKHFQKLNF